MSKCIVINGTEAALKQQGEAKGAYKSSGGKFLTVNSRLLTSKWRVCLSWARISSLDISSSESSSFLSSFFMVHVWLLDRSPPKQNKTTMGQETPKMRSSVPFSAATRDESSDGEEEEEVPQVKLKKWGLVDERREEKRWGEPKGAAPQRSSRVGTGGLCCGQDAQFDFLLESSIQTFNYNSKNMVLLCEWKIKQFALC